MPNYCLIFVVHHIIFSKLVRRRAEVANSVQLTSIGINIFTPANINSAHFGANIEMADEEMLLSLCATSVIAVIMRRRQKRRKKRKTWTQEWLKNRTSFGASFTLLAELRNMDVSRYRNFLRMDVTSFEELLQLVAEAKSSIRIQPPCWIFPPNHVTPNSKTIG